MNHNHENYDMHRLILYDCVDMQIVDYKSNYDKIIDVYIFTNL